MQVSQLMTSLSLSNALDNMIYLFQTEDGLIEEILKTFIGVVDAELLKAVALKILKQDIMKG